MKRTQQFQGSIDARKLSLKKPKMRYKNTILRDENIVNTIQSDESRNIQNQSRNEAQTELKTFVNPNRNIKPINVHTRSMLNKIRESSTQTAENDAKTRVGCLKRALSTQCEATDRITKHSFFKVYNALFGSEYKHRTQNILSTQIKAGKYQLKARIEEQSKYIQDLRMHISQIFEGVVQLEDSYSAIACEQEAMEQELIAAKISVTRSTERAVLFLKRLEEQEKISSTQISELKSGKDDLQARVNKALQDREQMAERMNHLETDLMTTKQANEKAEFEIQNLRSSISDRTYLFEERKKEMQHFYAQRDQEQLKTKCSEMEYLQKRLEEMAEKADTLQEECNRIKNQASIAEDSLKAERERRAQAELDHCAVQTLQQSMQDRLQQAQDECAEWKQKVKLKSEEMQQIVQSLTETQKFAASANERLDSEKNHYKSECERLQTENAQFSLQFQTLSSQLKAIQATAKSSLEAKIAAETRATDLQRANEELKTQTQEHLQQIHIKAAVCTSLETQMKDLRTEHIALCAQMEAMKTEIKQVILSRDKYKCCYEESSQPRTNEKVSEELEQLREAKVSLESEVRSLRNRKSHVHNDDLEELCAVKREAEVLRLRLSEITSHGHHSLLEKDTLIQKLEKEIFDGNQMRRSMHNKIQELRGNVRVFVRIRPFLPGEENECCVKHESDGESITLDRQKDAPLRFKFDTIFSPSTGQDQVFEQVSEFIQSSLDGYHVCLFSYGQTGSGKTHTMQGSGKNQMRGIIPRSIEKILDTCAKLDVDGWKYTIKVSFMEIYNETIRDLLTDEKRKLTVKRNSNGVYEVPGIQLVSVAELANVESLMEKANRAKSVAATDMNAQSSRAHSIFSVSLRGEHASKKIVLNGRLHLVDLAGSERTSRSNVSGMRLKETQAINKSLSALGNVFSAIRNKTPHIPFRDSKLTFLLQNCLAGDGKALMMVNLSPTLHSFQESLSSLRFAQQVSQCELGRAKRQLQNV